MLGVGTCIALLVLPLAIYGQSMNEAAAEQATADLKKEAARIKDLSPTSVQDAYDQIKTHILKATILKQEITRLNTGRTPVVPTIDNEVQNAEKMRTELDTFIETGDVQATATTVNFLPDKAPGTKKVLVEEVNSLHKKIVDDLINNENMRENKRDKWAREFVHYNHEFLHLRNETTRNSAKHVKFTILAIEHSLSTALYEDDLFMRAKPILEALQKLKVKGTSWNDIGEEFNQLLLQLNQFQKDNGGDVLVNTMAQNEINALIAKFGPLPKTK